MVLFFRLRFLALQTPRHGQIEHIKLLFVDLICSLGPVGRRERPGPARHDRPLCHPSSRQNLL